MREISSKVCFQPILLSRASNRLKYRSGLGSGFAKFIFSGLPPGWVFRRFDFAGLVKNTLNCRFQVRESKILKVQIRFEFKNLKPSVELNSTYVLVHSTGAFFSKILSLWYLG